MGLAADLMAVEVYVHPDTVDLTFEGLDRLLCLKDRVILPMDEILSAQVLPVSVPREQRGWRVLGGYLPGAFATGYFTVRGQKGARQLWCVYRDTEVLVIETTRKTPSKIVLQHPDRHNLAWLISERIPPGH